MEPSKTTDIAVIKQEVQLREWAAQIDAQQSSGLTVSKWCAENEINPKTFYYHLRKVREKFSATHLQILCKPPS